MKRSWARTKEAIVWAWMPAPSARSPYPFNRVLIHLEKTLVPRLTARAPFSLLHTRQPQLVEHKIKITVPHKFLGLLKHPRDFPKSMT